MAQQNTDAINTATAQPTERPSFLRFNRDNWVKWINAFLNEEYCQPSVTVGAGEPCVALANVYHQLDSKIQRDLFAEAVKILFESTPVIKQNSSYLRSILELLALLKPHHAKSLVRMHLFSRSFASLEDGSLNLHTLLLIVNSKYEMDEQLLEFIERTAGESNDFGYLVVCLRAVSQLGGTEYLNVLETILSKLDESQYATLLGRELGDIMYLHGSKNFCQWYSTTLRSMSKESPIFDAFEFLEEALKKFVFRTLNFDPPAQEAYDTLIAAQLHANDRFYNAREVVRIARLHTYVGKDATVDALVNIWNRIKTKSVGSALPWYYQSYPSRFRRLPCNVSSGPNPNTSISDTFFEDEEPILAEIFEELKDEGCGVPELRYKTA